MITEIPTITRLGSNASGGIPPGVKLDHVILPKPKINGPKRMIL